MINYIDSMFCFYLLLTPRTIYTDMRENIIIKQPYNQYTTEHIITNKEFYDVNKLIEQIFIKEENE